MFKTILLIAFSLFVSSTSAFAQLPELNIERPFRRCGTSMLLERDRAENNAMTRAISTSENYVPHSGSITVPVILVNFKDVKFTINNPVKAFDQFFNGPKQIELGYGNALNHGSVAEYFYDMSGGNFNVKFKIYGPVTVDNNETYYGGTNKNNNKDENPRQLVKDAIAKLQASSEKITDDSEFSSDNSTIDIVYIVYAGIGQNIGGDSTTVWACTGPFSTTFANKKTRWFSIASELSNASVDSNGKLSSRGTSPAIAGIGVTCHEFSHSLGLPDLYPAKLPYYPSNQEMELWDLMDGGEYSGSYQGYCPTAYTAFEKNEMGWPVSIKELSESQPVTMTESTLDGGTAYKIVNPSNSSEYFMLENIKRSGWNSEQCGQGLLVYHVNRPSGDLSLSSDFNNTQGYPRMAVVPADGITLSTDDAKNYSQYISSLTGDLFPGTGNMSPNTLNVTELSDAKPQPNFCWYDSELTQKLPTNKALQNIKYSNGVVTFNYIHDVAAGINDIRINMPADNRIFTVDGVYMGTNLNALPHGVYIINGRKIVK